MALLVAIVVMFNQMNGRLDALNDRMGRVQAETHGRLDALQAETNRRFDQAQAENNQRFDAILEAIGSFDRRVSRNEGQIEVIREQLQAEGAP